MATRATGETTASGSRETGGIGRNNTLHKPTYATPGQLHYHQQRKDRHTFQLTGPATVSGSEGSMETNLQASRPC